VSDRLTRLRAALARAEVDGVLVSQPESRRYLSGYSATDIPPRESAGYLLITPMATVLLTDPRTEALAATEAPGFDIRIYGGSKQDRFSDVLAAVCAEQRVGKLAFESQHLPYEAWRQMNERLGDDTKLVPAPDIVDSLRAVKDPDEIEALKVSIALNDAAFAHVVRNLEAGKRETDLAWEIEHFYRTHGAEGVSFDPITVGGPNTAIPHAEPSERPIQPDELVLFDIGAKVRGYCSDMTRTICIESAPPEMERVWNVVLDAQLEAERKARPGMTGSEVDALARDVIVRAGFGDQFIHGLGHGIGLEIHEPPWITRSRGEEVLQPGMVFSIEPGIYLSGVGGVRIEDLVLLTETGAEVLCASPKKLRLQEVLSDLDR
jgi:Xaa-Pro aminopeptidase